MKNKDQTVKSSQFKYGAHCDTPFQPPERGRHFEDLLELIYRGPKFDYLLIKGHNFGGPS